MSVWTAARLCVMCIFNHSRVIQKQMAFMLGRHGMFLELNEDVEDYEDLTEIMSNVQLNSNFLALAREVGRRREGGMEAEGHVRDSQWVRGRVIEYWPVTP